MTKANNAYSMLLQAVNQAQLEEIEKKRIELLKIAFDLQKKNRQNKKENR